MPSTPCIPTPNRNFCWTELVGVGYSARMVERSTMSVGKRESVGWLLSDLFVDTAHADDELRRLGVALKQTGFGPDEVERILRREVAPVCGRWMTDPGAIGPWPQFDRQLVEARIRAYVQRPWYKGPLFGAPLWLFPGVRREWAVVKRAMNDAEQAD
jgi:hypothetical protein